MSLTEPLSEKGLRVRTSRNQRKRNKMKRKQQVPNRIFLRLVLVAVFAIVLSGHYQSVNAQWGTNGNNISNTNTGNVGVGTTSPDKLFTVQGTVPDPLGAMSVFRTTGSNNGAGLLMDATG